jgi:hypothetical protein
MQVYVEATDTKAFACSVEWPGWCRSGRDEGAALEQLMAYSDRYAEVARCAHVAFEPGDPRVVERVVGNMTTSFGAPGVVPACDEGAPVTADAVGLLEAAWQLLADVAAGAPAELRKGPRGGGRDRDKVVQHVVSAESAFARKIGVKHREPAFTDATAVRSLRDDIITTLRAPAEATAWPMRYFLRRASWHVLDHAWEIQDRST